MLYLAAVAFTIAYDTIYALMDKDDDKHLGIGSTALFFANYERSFLIVIYSLAFIALSLSMSSGVVILSYTECVFIGFCYLILITYIQQLIVSLHKNTPQTYLDAFRGHSVILLLIFAMLVLLDIT